MRRPAYLVLTLAVTAGALHAQPAPRASGLDGRRIALGRDSLRVDTKLAPGVIDGASFDMALRAAPLDAPWTGEFVAFLSNVRSTATLSARVTGVETIAGVPCWRVDALFASMPVTFWIERETRRLRQQVMEVGSGMRVLFAPMPAAQGSRDRVS